MYRNRQQNCQNGLATSAERNLFAEESEENDKPIALSDKENRQNQNEQYQKDIEKRLNSCESFAGTRALIQRKCGDFLQLSNVLILSMILL